MNPADFAKRYKQLSDEELAAIEAEGLVPEARAAYEAEVARRTPMQPASDVGEVKSGPVPASTYPAGSQDTSGSSETARRGKRVLVTIVLWLELVAALGPVQAFLRDIGQPLPMVVFTLFAFLLLLGVIGWRQGKSSIGEGKVLLYGLLPLAIGVVVGVPLSMVSAFKGIGAGHDPARVISIEHLVGLVDDPSYCDGFVKLEGTVREIAPGQSTSRTKNNRETYDLEDGSSFITVILDERLGRPTVHQHLEVVGLCKCSQISPIFRIVYERTRTSK